MYRDSEKVVKNFLTARLKNSPVLIIQGARQVGKTYLIESVLKNRERIISINFEKEPQAKLEIDSTKDFSEFTRWLETRHGFKNGSDWTIYIDEAQESEKLGSYIRFMKEEWQFTKTILSGSSMCKIFQEKQRVPVGRIQYLTLQPFSFREFLRCGDNEMLLDKAQEAGIKTPEFLHKQLLELLDEYLVVGGMPEVVKSYFEKKDYKEIFNFIIASQRDDFLRKEQVKSYLFIDALKGIANHVGTSAKFTQISTNIYDAKKIIQKLIEWFIVYQIDIIGSLPTQNFYPKRYLYDIGILRHIRESSIPRISILNTLDEQLRTPLGGLLENAVFLSLIQGKGGYVPISAWRQSNKNPIEIDFIYKEHEKILPIEVKASLNLKRRHFLNLAHYSKLHHIKEGVIISLAKKETFKQSKELTIKNIPAYLVDGSECLKNL